MNRYSLVFASPGFVISGLLVYNVLGAVNIPYKTSLTIAVLISVITFGLTYYYVKGTRRDPSIERGNEDQIAKEKRKEQGKKIEQVYPEQIERIGDSTMLSSIIFAAAYISFLVLSVVLPGLGDDGLNDGIFIEWQDLNTVDITKLGSAIALSFFVPGYALVSIILPTNRSLGILPVILFSYLLSMFIAGFTGYIMSMLGFEITDIRSALVILYLVILIVFMQKRLDVFRKVKSAFFNGGNYQFRVYLKFQINKINFKTRWPLLVVFGSLLIVIIFSTLILHGGIIIGDQWYHHGRAVQFVLGDYDIIEKTNSDFVYPPLLPALLSSFFSLADVPSVNAYASIGFLNAMAIFAFYYFCTKWLPANKRKSALLAAAFFTLSSGFGWIHAVSLFVSDSSNLTQTLSIQTILTSSKQTYDIRTPSTFLLASHPDFSTGLQLIVLPVGFLLLGMVKEDTKNRKERYRYILVISMGLVLGIFSHDEIYFFIIIASILPPIFKLRYQNYLYVGLLSAIGVALFAHYIYSEDYLGSTIILGMPLITICFFFVAFMWLLYLTRPLERIFEFINRQRSVIEKVSRHFYKRPRVIIGIASVLIVTYLYAFTFITWSELSLRDIEIQTSESFPRNVPWYLFPMKLGLVGILGVCYLLLCIFRKFEKEVLVFVIIGVIAIFTGPYYDEHRFSKYLMAALAGLASLMVYEIIIYLNSAKIHFRYLLDGLLLGVIIVLSSVSTLMFVSYDSWSLEHDTENSDLIWLNRRNFPSSSELQMIEFLRNNNEPSIKSISNTSVAGIQSVATWPDEYQTRLGLLGKFQGFAGIPIPLMLQSPLALNATSLESFYSLLSSSGTSLIVVPSREIYNVSEVLGADAGEKYVTNETGSGIKINAAGQPAEIFSDVAKFSMRNFKKVYQDNDYTILEVPNYLNPPSPYGDVAIIHPTTQEDIVLRPLASMDGNHNNNNTNNNRIPLPYTSQFFDKISNSDFVKVLENKKGVTLNAYNKSQTLWSSKIEYGNGGPNYVGSEFQVISQNETRPHDECGVLWESEGKKYYVRIRDDKLAFSETPAPKVRYIIENQQVNLDRWIPYTLKVLFLGDYLKIYVNDILRLKVPSNLYDNSDPISRVGIRCAGNIAEFGPIEIARISAQEALNRNYNTGKIGEEQDSKYYYPLTSLALSRTDYDSFLPDDNSVFSRRNIVIATGASGNNASDEINNKDQMGRFLKYVWNGGTITVVNTVEEGDGWLANSFLSIEYGNRTSEFDSIVDPAHSKYTVKVSGNVSVIKSMAPDARVKSYYEKNNVAVSPFSIEKSFGKGEIVYVDAAGYFDAISHSPDQYFSSLADIPRLFGIYNDKLNPDFVANNTSFANYYNLGNITFVGDLTINSSSLLLPIQEGGNNDFNKAFKVQDVYIINHPGKKINAKSSGLEMNNDTNNSTSSRDIGNKSSYHDTGIRNLDLYGLYKASIKTSGKVNLPSYSYPLSESDYFGMSIPTGFDLVIQLLDKDAHVNITKADGTKTTVYHVAHNGNKMSENDVTEIYFHDIKPVQSQTDSFEFLVKRPEISARGDVSFDSLFQGQYDFDVSKGIEGNPLELTDANLEMGLGYVDGYDKSSRNKHTTDYLTYIRTLQIDESSGSSDTVELKTPGDISDKAKEDGIFVPWRKAMASDSNLILLSSLIGGMLLGIYLVRHKRRRSSKIGQHADVSS